MNEFKNQTEEYSTLEKMNTYGGSFVKGLAGLYWLADPANKAKLRKAFWNYFDEYRKKYERISPKEDRKRKGSKTVVGIEADKTWKH